MVSVMAFFSVGHGSDTTITGISPPDSPSSLDYASDVMLIHPGWPGDRGKDGQGWDPCGDDNDEGCERVEMLEDASEDTAGTGWCFPGKTH